MRHTIKQTTIKKESVPPKLSGPPEHSTSAGRFIDVTRPKEVWLREQRTLAYELWSHIGNQNETGGCGRSFVFCFFTGAFKSPASRTIVRCKVTNCIIGATAYRVRQKKCCWCLRLRLSRIEGFAAGLRPRGRLSLVDKPV